MRKTIKKAQAGISTISERGRLGKNKMVTSSTSKILGGDYKVKTKGVVKKGSDTSKETTKVKRTLKGVLSGKPSPKKLGLDTKKTTYESFPSSNLYKKGGKISKKKK